MNTHLVEGREYLSAHYTPYKPFECQGISWDKISSTIKCLHKSRWLAKLSATTSKGQTVGEPHWEELRTHHVDQVGKNALHFVDVHVFHLHEFQGDQERIQGQLVCPEQQAPGRGKQAHTAYLPHVGTWDVNKWRAGSLERHLLINHC